MRSAILLWYWLQSSSQMLWFRPKLFISFTGGRSPSKYCFLDGLKPCKFILLLKNSELLVSVLPLAKPCLFLFIDERWGVQYLACWLYWSWSWSSFFSFSSSMWSTNVYTVSLTPLNVLWISSARSLALVAVYEILCSDKVCLFITFCSYSLNSCFVLSKSSFGIWVRRTLGLWMVLFLTMEVNWKFDLLEADLVESSPSWESSLGFLTGLFLWGDSLYRALFYKESVLR